MKISRFCLAVICFLLVSVSGSIRAIAQSSEDASSPVVSSKREPKKLAASLEARHRDCLAFIQRHGISCDPRVTPTCGHDIGYVRLLSCVAS